MNVSVLQYGVVRHIGDELLIVVPESDSATDPKKQVWGQQFFFSCWLKGHNIQKVRWSYICEYNTTRCLLLGMRRSNIQYWCWPGGGLLWRGYRKWNVFVTELAVSCQMATLWLFAPALHRQIFLIWINTKVREVWSTNMTLFSPVS